MSSRRYLYERSATDSWNEQHISCTALRTLSSILMSCKKDWATVSSASLGHAVNQSMVVQLTSEGNLRRRVRNESPMGDMQSAMWSSPRQFWTKKRIIEPGVKSVMPISLALGWSVSQICETSSPGKSWGTSPVFRMLLMSSTIASSLTCVSVNRKTVGLSFSPAPRSTFFRSSRHATMS